MVRAPSVVKNNSKRNLSIFGINPRQVSVADPDYHHYRLSGSQIIQKIIKTRIIFMFILLLKVNNS